MADDVLLLSKTTDRVHAKKQIIWRSVKFFCISSTGIKNDNNSTDGSSRCGDFNNIKWLIVYKTFLQRISRFNSTELFKAGYS